MPSHGPFSATGFGFESIGADAQLKAVHVKVITAGHEVRQFGTQEPFKLYQVGWIATASDNHAAEFDALTGNPYAMLWRFIEFSRWSWQLDNDPVFANGICWGLSVGTELSITVFW